MVMHTTSADAFGYAAQPVFGRRRTFVFDQPAAAGQDTDVTTRIARLRLTVALSALGLLASAVLPLAVAHGGQILGAALGLASLVVLSQTFDALHRLKTWAAEDEDEGSAPAFDRRPLRSFRRGAR